MQLYETECSYDDLLEMANDINKGDNVLDFKARNFKEESESMKESTRVFSSGHRRVHKSDASFLGRGAQHQGRGSQNVGQGEDRSWCLRADQVFAFSEAVTELPSKLMHFLRFRTYVKPLLRMLRKQTVTDDIRDSLIKMVKYALQRDYILCNEAYMEMAIGNAPWPIGVTNAGIHAR